MNSATGMMLFGSLNTAHRDMSESIRIWLRVYESAS